MLKSKYDGFFETMLQPFAGIVQSQYYDDIENSCLKTRRQVEKIRKIERSGTQFQYISQCESVVANIENHIKQRKEIYIPYVYELADKVVNNHNCSNCSGGCSVNHAMYVMELNATNATMQDVLSRLQMISLPLYSETVYPDEYRVLRSDMTLLETELTELFFIESNYLIPKIIDAQKQINGSSK